VSLLGDSCAQVVTRANLVAVPDRLAEEAARWQDAYWNWERAVKVRDRVAARMDRKLLAATGGVSVARFAAVCRRRSVRSVVEAERKASPIQAKPAVEVAMAERDRSLAGAGAGAGAAVLAARLPPGPSTSDRVAALGREAWAPQIGWTARR
jgi:hypothetical protein